MSAGDELGEITRGAPKTKSQFLDLPCLVTAGLNPVVRLSPRSF